MKVPGASVYMAHLTGTTNGTFLDAVCAACGNSGGLWCGGCGHIRYCGAVCRAAHWERHRAVCGHSASQLVAAAPMAPVVRHYLTKCRPDVSDIELGVVAALAETLPWMLHVLAAYAILGVWSRLECLADVDLIGDPRIGAVREQARSNLKAVYALAVETCPSAPDPTHGQTVAFLSALSRLHPRIKNTAMDATKPWFAAVAQKFPSLSGSDSGVPGYSRLVASLNTNRQCQSS
jgi:hypothetical protein